MAFFISSARWPRTLGFMNNHLRAATIFGLSSLVASLPVAWFFRGLPVPGNTFGSALWVAMPPIAIFASAGAAFLVIGLAPLPRFGFWRGAFAALIALVACAAVGHPVLVLPALAIVTWFVVPLGGLVGWLLQRYLMNPNPPPQTDGRTRPSSVDSSRAPAVGRER